MSLKLKAFLTTCGWIAAILVVSYLIQEMVAIVIIGMVFIVAYILYGMILDDMEHENTLNKRDDIK